MDINTLYRKLPRVAQNAALTWFGYQQFQIRYGQPLPAPYEAADLHGEISSELMQEQQAHRFGELIAHAGTHVPYYRQLFDRLGVQSSDITLDNFRDILPVLNKSEIVAHPELFHSEAFNDKNSIKLFTSGTSGSPMPIKCSLEARAINYAFYRSLLKKHGCDVLDRSAVFAGRLVVAESEKSEFARKDFYTKTLYLSSYHLTEQNMPAYLRALEQWGPLFIDSYPSAVAQLAEYIVRHGIKPKLSLRFVLTSSETLTEQQRRNIEQAFACRVLDHYGCTEMAVSARSDCEGEYAVDSLYSLVEFIPSGTGQSVVCSGLLNFAMPLLRYAIGDVVRDACVDPAHPFVGQTFAQVVGREDDVIVTSDGRKIGRMDPAFKGMSGIKLAQIIQHSVTDIEVLVVPGSSFDRDVTQSQLAANIRERTSPDMQVRIRLVDEIPLNKAGKFKSVISRIKHRL